MSFRSFPRCGGLLLLAVALGCGNAARSFPADGATRVAPAVILRHSDILPVYVEDLALGSRSAKVTIVAFLDLQCPYCAQGWQTVVRVQKQFGPEQVRIVVKHLPLPFHAHATPAARQVLELQRSYGDGAALAFLDRLFQNQSQIGDTTLRAWAQSSVPSAPDTVDSPAFSLSVAEQLQRDRQLAALLGINGTPEFRINGISVSGAVAESEFEQVIGNELAAVKELLRAGMPAGDVYASRVASNHPARDRNAGPPKEQDPTRWAIPLDNSPQLGPNTAPVAIVGFFDYECPFCLRGFETLKQLRDKYRDKIRIVWKHRPLGFHEHANAASTLAIGVRKQKGDEAFWRITDELFAHQDGLAELTSLPILATLGVDARMLQSPAFEEESRAVLLADSDLADDFGVDGTPQFFVNGWRVKGARPLEEFSAVIDGELDRAASLREKGTKEAEVFSALTAEARPAPEHATVAPGTVFPDGPSIGPARAKVTIRVFSDYQCPFCQRAEATLNEVRNKFPNDVRIVWYDLPLGMHDRARAAATLAREVRAQRGDEAFFRINHVLFEKQADLSEAALVTYTRPFGVHEDKLAPAQREQTHGPGVDRDQKLAEDLGISGTPTFVVERFLLEGAQPANRFERLIRRVLAEKASAETKPRKK